MAGLRTLYRSDPKDEPGLRTNFNVDYVIHYKIPPAEEAEAEASFVQMIEALGHVGFATKVRRGAESSLLVFTRIVSDKLLADQVYHSRLQDWLFGVRTAAPGQDLSKFFEDEPVTEAERLRLAYLLITKPQNEGGAGIMPKTGRWKHVVSLFPLHDHVFNSAWLKDWSAKYFLSDDDLMQIRDRFGEQVAFYFAFLQSYFSFLLFPASFGLGAWLVLGKFSWFYATVNCLWSVVFFEHWKMKEVDYAVRWGVRGVSKIQQPRPQFRFEREAVDPVTGELVKVYSPYKRLARQLLQVPFALACLVILGGLIASCFAVEIFITEVYNGPFKQYLTFLPTVILTIFNPTLSTLLTILARRLTDLENYDMQDAHQASMIQKIFVINFITSYVPILLTAFVYVPFGKLLVPYLDVFSLSTARLTAEGKPLPTKQWVIDPDRLTKQVIYFTVTAQIVNFLTETIVPYVKRKVFKAVKEVQTEVSGKSNEQKPTDSPEEAAFLKRVQNEAELDVYDVTIDYREMVIQFGYLSLFSVIWPLTACSFLVNNWVEARGDAMKIAISSQRPIPWRADSIGPWLSSLGFMSWLGSLTSAALVYLFSSDATNHYEPDGSPHRITAWALLLCLLLAEHVYLLLQFVVRGLMAKVDSPGLQRERAQRFAMRKQFLEQTFGNDVLATGRGEISVVGGLKVVQQEEKMTREALEEEARRLANMPVEERFWQRQRGTNETIQVGRNLISEMTTKQGHKTD